MDSNSTAPPALLPGQSPPLTVITPTDQGGILYIATALALIFAFISILIRLFIRMEFRHSFSNDDIAALLAMVGMIIQSSLMFAGVSDGFGKTGADIADPVVWQKYTYVTDIFYLLTLWLSKASVALLFLRLSPDKNHMISAYAFLGTSTVFMVASVFAVCLRCDLAAPWLFANVQCPGLFARWQAVTAFDIITEVALFFITIYVVYGLQLPTSKKLVVLFAFGMRLPVIAPSALHLYYLGIEFASADPSLDGVLAAVCAQIQLSYAIVATTTPCLRPFMFALSTNYGGPTHTRTPGNTVKKGTNDISLGSMSGESRIGRSEKRETKTTQPTTRWDGAEYNVNVVSGDGTSLRSNDSRRMIISKNTEWTVNFESQSRGDTASST